MAGKILGKTDILKADDLEKELVKVPEWGGSVYVRTMTGAELERMSSKGDIKNSDILAACICDEQGESLFSKDEIKDLAKKSAVILNRLTLVACKINKLDTEDVKVLEKN